MKIHNQQTGAIGSIRPSKPQVRTGVFGFSRTDLVFTIAAGSLLFLLTVGMTSRESAERVQCANNMRQLGVAALSFSDENEGEFPPRRPPPNHWIPRLKSYYLSDRIVTCPTKRTAEITPHSYLINGFGDFFEAYFSWEWTRGMRRTDIAEPSTTIIFGEKEPRSSHVHMDFQQGMGNDLEELDHGRHFAGGGKERAASNHTFADGSVRLLRYGASMAPINMWAIIPEWRSQPLQLLQ